MVGTESGAGDVGPLSPSGSAVCLQFGYKGAASSLNCLFSLRPQYAVALPGRGADYGDFILVFEPNWAFSGIRVLNSTEADHGTVGPAPNRPD